MGKPADELIGSPVHVLVTGGLGFIGHHVSLALIERGVRVTILDLPKFGAVSLPGVSARRSDAEAEIVVADLLEPDQWTHHLRGVDAVVHCAGVHQVDEIEAHPLRHVEVNVGGTRRLLEAMVEHEVPRLVNLSSAKVYGQNPGRPSTEDDIVAPVGAYALGKVVAEQYGTRFATDHGLEVCSVRPFSVFGPGQSTNTGYVGALLDAVCHGGRVIIPGSAEMMRDFVSIDTVVDTCVAAALTDGAPPPLLNCGSGEATTLAELTRTFSAVAGREFEVTYREPRAGTLRVTLADVERMNRFAAPRLPTLSEALAPTIAACLGMP